MSKRKDLRNHGESLSWKPSHWSVSKRRRFTSHTLVMVLMEFEREWGSHEGNLQFAKFSAEHAERISAAGLAAAGIRTVGA